MNSKVFIDFDGHGRIVMWNDQGKKILTRFPFGYTSVSELLCTKKPTKRLSQDFLKMYGIIPTNVRKIFNGFMKSRVFDENKEWNKLVYRGPSQKIYSYNLKSIESKDIYEQCKKDGINNVIPICALFNKSPQELKKEFGKSLWKKITKNSYTKNRKIYHVAIKAHAEDRNQDSLLGTLNMCVDMPSTLIHPHTDCEDFYKHVVANKLVMKHYAKGTTKALNEESRKIFNTYHDTRSMAMRLNQPFNPEWSVRRMHEEHERLVRDQQAILRKRQEEHSKIKFTDFQNLPTIKYNDVIATPLITASEVIDEGQRMKHCVGGYSNACINGTYVVYSLDKNGKKSTLGISRDKFHGMNSKITTYNYNFSQHYHECNKSIEDDDFKVAATAVINQLNKVN